MEADGWIGLWYNPTLNFNRTNVWLSVCSRTNKLFYNVLLLTKKKEKLEKMTQMFTAFSECWFMWEHPVFLALFSDLFNVRKCVSGSKLCLKYMNCFKKEFLVLRSLSIHITGSSDSVYSFAICLAAFFIDRHEWTRRLWLQD